MKAPKCKACGHLVKRHGTHIGCLASISRMAAGVKRCLCAQTRTNLVARPDLVRR